MITKSPSRFLNREVSWLEFNSRVLSESRNPDNPLLERLKFLAIFEDNLDEFFMVRVSGLMEQSYAGVTEKSPDGLTPEDQIEAILEKANSLRRLAGATWAGVQSELEVAGIRVVTWDDLSDRQCDELRQVFLSEYFALCTPLILDPAPTVPFISNRSLNLAVVLGDEQGATKLARVKIPDTEQRALKINKRRHDYLPLEELVRNNLDALFPGVQILGAYRFRLLRDADVEIRELEAGDLIEAIEQTLKQRRFGDPVHLEVGADMPTDVRTTLLRILDLDPENVYDVDGLMGLRMLWELAAIEKPGLRFPTHVPRLSPTCSTSNSLFETIREGEVLVHHPFDSFQSVEAMVSSAATDPSVVGIKQTLYRVGSHSPIVESLLAAAEDGKQVAAMVELKARFDESNNLEWARVLERAGVHVTFGFPELKTHCKLCLVVRRESGRIRMYAHIGTGNYNPSTARLYTDLGLFTDDPAITQDVAELFNYLTGFSKQSEYRKLLVAPINLRSQIVAKIRREAEHWATSGKGEIAMKMNALVDPQIIDALYEASQAGVPIRLIVRGICCLRPGVPGLSETIQVCSVVGRFLEHSRVYYFENGGDPEAYIGSADMMTRNLSRRIEVLAPVQSPKSVRTLRDLMALYWKDNTNSWDLDGDGRYHRRSPDGTSFTVQHHLM